MPSNPSSIAAQPQFFSSLGKKSRASATLPYASHDLVDLVPLISAHLRDVGPATGSWVLPVAGARLPLVLSLFVALCKISRCCGFWSLCCVF